MNENNIIIENTKTDSDISLLKSIFGTIPFAGSILSEVVGQIIPNQRLDRITKFCRILEEKLSTVEIEIEELKKRFKEEIFIDLFEDGVFQSIRALSNERHEYIASILKNSFSQEEINYLQQKKLLNILSQLNDAEIIHFQYHYTEKNSMLSSPSKFFKKHEDILMPIVITLSSTQEDIDKHSIQQSYKTHLVSLGLLKLKFKKTKKSEFPEFDEKTGMIKSSGYERTELGRLLLTNMDMKIS